MQGSETPRSSRRRRRAAAHSQDDQLRPDGQRVVELREEELVANKTRQDLGEIVIRTVVESTPAELEVDAQRDEVEVVHEPVGEAVTERHAPWEEDGVMVIPVYEEQLVVTKRLLLRERIRVRQFSTTERQLFQDTVRRERLVVEDPQQTGRVHEIHPTDTEGSADSKGESDDRGLLTRMVTKALE